MTKRPFALAASDTSAAIRQALRRPFGGDWTKKGFVPTNGRVLLLVAALAVQVGLVFGIVVSSLWLRPGLPASGSAVQLDVAAQQDYIITVAEAFASDRNLDLARDRLARLHSPDAKVRVEQLAASYAPAADFLAARLAHLAVALGSTDPVLLALNTQSGETSLALAGALLAESAGPVMPELLEQAPAAAESAPVAVSTPEPVEAGQGSARLPTTAKAGRAAVVNTPPLLPGQRTGRAAEQSQPAPPPATDEQPAAPEQQAPAPDDAERPGQRTAKTPTRKPTAAAKPAGAATPKVAAAEPAPNKIASTIRVNVPAYTGAPSVSIPLTARPAKCTPASDMPAVVSRSIALCPGQPYGPFRVEGDTITVFGDKSAVVRGAPRGYAITARGSRIAIVEVRVEGAAHPDDSNTWLCFFDSCNDGRGPVGYGGGILLDHTTNSAVASSQVRSGAVGIAAVGGAGNRIFENELSGLNAWGILSVGEKNQYVVGNNLHDINRSCTGPDGSYFGAGCESSGLAALQVRDSVIASNHCERAANCYYAAGGGGNGSFDNQFMNNYCSSAGNNCFEVTFSRGNRFDYNVAAGNCDYPFWVGGSTVQFGSHNRWSCKHTPEQALKEARQSTQEPTAIEGLQ